MVKTRRQPILILRCLALSLALLCPATASSDGSPQIEQQIDSLLEKMTIEEKVGQLNLISNDVLFDWSRIASGEIGALINFNNAQDIARAEGLAKQARLGIPLFFGLDVVHGFRTQFPVPLGEAAAFSADLSRKAARVMAEESRYVGVNWTYAPMADLSRDVRWGRMVEGFGEDPHLGAVLTAARVEGIQAGGLVATAKHFAGYGAPVGGRDYAATFIPLTELRDVYLPSFHAAVRAGTGSIMSAFNALNGIPSTASRELLTGILRNEWGFDGFVTSDWAGIQELIAHGIAANEMEATVKAFTAGVDMDMMSGFYSRNLAKAVHQGLISEKAVDTAVRRVLRIKLRAGLFTRESTDPKRVDSVFPTTESRLLARQLAGDSYVLLKNDKAVLPFSSDVRSVAVIGPLADQPCEQLGPHAARGHCEDAISYLKGIESRAKTAKMQINYAPGCDLFCRNADEIAKAVAIAQTSDIIVAVLGEPRDASGEAASKAYLDLPGHQGALLEALLNTGKPVVLVLMSGRPLDIKRQIGRLSAVLMTWYPGTEGGNALADVLFGDRNPSGRLPVSYPRSIGQVPLYYNDLPSGRPHLPENRFTYGYYDEAVTPLFPFGWGLSYTSFAYSNLRLAKDVLSADETIEVQVAIANRGTRSGEEVVQLYLRDVAASRSRPVRELKAFARVALAPGEQRDVTLRVPVRDIGFHTEDGSYVVEAGTFRLWVGGSSEAELGGTLTVSDGFRQSVSSRRVQFEAE